MQDPTQYLPPPPSWPGTPFSRPGPGQMAQQLGPLRLLVRSRAQALMSPDLLSLRESERLKQGGLRVAALSPSLCVFGYRRLIFFSDSTLRCKNQQTMLQSQRQMILSRRDIRLTPDQ